MKAWVDSKRGIANLASSSGEITALADLRSRVATVIVPEDADPGSAAGNLSQKFTPTILASHSRLRE